LKVVLMSASLNAEMFASYFRVNGRAAPTFDIPGTLFPVREFFLEDVLRLTHYSAPKEDFSTDAELSGDRPMQRIDMDLVESLLLKLLERDRVPAGSGILVFLPGMGDILNLSEVRRITGGV
jgi:HrpA-like RNA helicase